MKHRKTALAILAGLSTSVAVADEFKTIDGKEYKNATISRVEPDGIVLRTKSGISKLYFAELPKEVQNAFITILRMPPHLMPLSRWQNPASELYRRSQLN